MQYENFRYNKLEFDTEIDIGIWVLHHLKLYISIY